VVPQHPRTDAINHHLRPRRVIPRVIHRGEKRQPAVRHFRQRIRPRPRPALRASAGASARACARDVLDRLDELAHPPL
jgi:hypothetical protein